MNRLLIIFFFFNVGCNGQTNHKKTITDKDTMQIKKFDVKAFEHYTRQQLTLGLNGRPYQKTDTLTNGTIEETAQSNTDYTKTITPPPPALFKTKKVYYLNGSIKEIHEQQYVGVMLTPHGVSKYYNANGLTEEYKNNNTFYEKINVKLTDLFKILERAPLLDMLDEESRSVFHKIWFPQKNENDITVNDVLKKLAETRFEDKTYRNNGKMLNPNDDQDRKSLIISFDKNIWMIKKDIYPFGYIETTVDANSGKILSKKYHKETRG